MNKIQLSIPKPCQEDWNKMTEKEKGRFCSFCQKTVIDFTRMSDRQIVEFFKKRPPSVCGRIKEDQLNRDMTIPKKRIPWIRYFFSFTWPAFLLFLKSCGIKDNSKEEMSIVRKKQPVTRESLLTLGMMLPEIKPIDTASVVAEKQGVQEEIMGGMELIQKTEAVATAVAPENKMPLTHMPVDTAASFRYDNENAGCAVLVGGISIKTVVTMEDTVDRNETQTSEALTLYEVYPNPVRAGSVVNVSLEGQAGFPKEMQFFSSSGQLVTQVKEVEKNAASIGLEVPSHCAAGVYYLRITTSNEEVKTTKVVITK